MLNLYHLAGTDPNDLTNDCSLLVVASNPADAHLLWKTWWWDGEAAEFFTGSVWTGDPDVPADVLKIYEVVYDPDTRGVLGWGRDVHIVGYVLP